MSGDTLIRALPRRTPLAAPSAVMMFALVACGGSDSGSDTGALERIIDNLLANALPDLASGTGTGLDARIRLRPATTRPLGPHDVRAARVLGRKSVWSRAHRHRFQ
ncbi:hypothetical protein [Streptomyces sp. NPDC001480]|uniref:hypothetical protein n=1 Tax=Streptomyces sp. NPDC001480 TaxID=3364577 RepID=UPI0036816CA1